MNRFLQDLRHAMRRWRKNLGFTTVAVVTLALGIGVSPAIFSVVYVVLLRPLTYLDPGRTMAILEVETNGRWDRLADPNFDDFRDQNRSFQKMVKYSAYIVPVSGASQPSRSFVAHISPDFFAVFRVQSIIGRDLTMADAQEPDLWIAADRGSENPSRASHNCDAVGRLRTHGRERQGYETK